jgi:hypothetical protein
MVFLSKLQLNTKPSERVILIASYLLVVTSVVISIVVFGWTATWNFLGVPAMEPYFADLRTIQGAIASDALGLNPQATNPGDPWDRRMNYPLIWLTVAQALQLNNELHFLIFGLVIVTTFIAATLYLLNRFTSTLLLACLLSGSTLLALERGNNDLLVFSLVFLFALISSRWGMAYLTIATSIKLFGFLALVGGNPRISQIASIIGLQIISLVVLIPQISDISSGNTATGVLSYGLLTTVSIATDVLQGLELSYVMKVALGIILIVAGTASLLLIKKFARVPKSAALVEIEEAKRRFFLAGAGIYCGTYFLTSSWDYRLIFLVLCIPFLRSVEGFLYSKLLPIFILLSMNYFLLSMALPNYLAAAINQLSKAAVFLILAVLVAKMLIGKEGLLSRMFRERKASSS